MNAVVGRQVWYYPGGYPVPSITVFRDQPGKPVQACTARICYVHSPSMVNLDVVDHAGQRHARSSVHLVPPGEQPPDGAEFCIWPSDRP